MRSKQGLIRIPPHTPMADQSRGGLFGVFGNGLHAASVRSPTLSKRRGISRREDLTEWLNLAVSCSSINSTLWLPRLWCPN
jgi:hypothetical protein